MLHTVNKSPHSHSALADCLRVCGEHGAVLLIEDGVYAALAGNAWLEPLRSVKAVYALAPDVAARGLEQRIAKGIQLVDYAGFVRLCCEHSTTQSWY